MQAIHVVAVRRTATLQEPYPSELIDKLTSYQIPGVYFMPAYNRWTVVREKVDGQWRERQVRVWDGRRHFLKHGTLPLGLAQAIRPELEKQGYRLQIDYEERNPVAIADWSVADDETRPYQKEAIQAMVQASDLGGLLLSATGTGKTHSAGIFFKVTRPKMALFVVDELTLLHQAQEEIQRVMDEPVGLVGESRYEPKRVTVATTQTLSKFRHTPKFRQWFDSLDFVVIDEIHTAMARREFKILESIPKVKAVYGLTATLNLKRAETRVRAYAVAGPVLYTYPIQKAVQEGFLTPAVAVIVPFDGENSGLYLPGMAGRANFGVKRGYVGGYRRDYQADYTRMVVENPDRNRIVVELTEALVADGRKVIVLVERVRHLEILSEELKHLKPELVWGGKKRQERQESKERFEQGTSRVILANKVFAKGVDIRTVDAGIDATAHKSKESALQKLGRLVRLSKGKEFVLYFDISDRGNRFERAAGARLRAYGRAQIPAVRMRAMERTTRIKSWYERAKAVAKTKVQNYFSAKPSSDEV